MIRRFKRWALDVGLWEAPSIEQWRWAAFRPCFWSTYTNGTHRTYRKLFEEVTTNFAEQMRGTYEQGLRDGALQAVEITKTRLTGETPFKKYVN